MTTFQAVLGLLLVLLVARWVWARRLRASGLNNDQRAELRSAKRKLRGAETDHAAAVRDAERRRDEAVDAHQARIARAKDELEALRDPRGRILATYRGHTLHEHVIVTPKGESSLVGASAVVDTAGNLTTTSRATLTRMAAGGVVAGPVGAILSLGFKKSKNIDRREVYLLIDAGEAASVTDCPGDAGLVARAFAMQVNVAAEAEVTFRRQLPGLLLEAQQELVAAEAATGPIEAAQGDIARVTNDPDAMARTRAACRQLELVQRSHASGEPDDRLTGPPAARRSG